MNEIRIIARNSNLSQIQVKEITDQLKNIAFKTIFIESLGDKQKHISLMENIPADFFTREIDTAIIDEIADIAIHSAKDLPYPVTKGLEVIALTQAQDKTDSLVSRNNFTLKTLPEGSVIGTSSSQRQQQILEVRPDLKPKSIRGTIEERLQQLNEGKYDAIIVATCALKRLQLENKISEILPFETHALQGNLAVIAKTGNSYLKELFSSIDIRKNYGKSYIVGAGPGDPDLITIKAFNILSKADVILYDSLVNPILLQGTQSKNIFVGKRKDHHTYSQDEINAMFYEHIIQGENTVRLKGGDPMIFGRGGEEFDYLRERLAEVEIIPGISAAIGASSSAAIPLTHRNISSSVSFLTGYPEDKLCYPDTDTLVYYMGATNAFKIAAELIRKGRSESTPVLIVTNATLPNEEKLFTNLKELAAQKIVPVSPSILIIGEVAVDNNFKYSKPKNLQILFTGTDCSNYTHLGKLIHFPLIEISPIKYNSSALDHLLNSDYDYIILTSKYAVRFFIRILLDSKRDIRWFQKKQVISIGNSTSKALLEHYIQADIQMKDESSTGIINWFKQNGISNKKILIPRSEKGLAYLPDTLKSMGLEVNIFSVYKNSIPENIEKPDLSKIGAIVFTSPSTVENFITIYGEIPTQLSIISRGEQTSKKLLSLGVHPLTMEEFEKVNNI